MHLGAFGQSCSSGDAEPVSVSERTLLCASLWACRLRFLLNRTKKLAVEAPQPPSSVESSADVHPFGPKTSPRALDGAGWFVHTAAVVELVCALEGRMRLQESGMKGVRPNTRVTTADAAALPHSRVNDGVVLPSYTDSAPFATCLVLALQLAASVRRTMCEPSYSVP